jgi:nucleoside-diphosphate-sugar epimerase
VAAVHFDMTLSQTLAVEQLGYRPRYSMEEGIRITGDWLKRQGEQPHG